MDTITEKYKGSIMICYDENVNMYNDFPLVSFRALLMEQNYAPFCVNIVRGLESIDPQKKFWGFVLV